ERKLIRKISEKTGTKIPLTKLKETVRKFEDCNRRNKTIDVAENKSVYVRHPLTYFMTCADDICYLSSDLEDAFNYGTLDKKTVATILNNLKIAKVGK